MKRFEHPDTGLQLVSTKDLYLAAFYGISGLEISEAILDEVNSKVSFIYEDSEELKSLTVAYYSGEALVEPHELMEKVYDLKNICINLRKEVV